MLFPYLRLQLVVYRIDFANVSESVFSIEPLACLLYFKPEDYDILRSKVYPHVHCADEYITSITEEKAGLVMDNLR